MLKACSRVLATLLLAASMASQNAPNEAVEQAGRRDPNEDSLDVARIRESPAKDVGEALSALDGFWKIRKGGIADDVVFRGFQQDNLNLLIDGERIYGACPGNMDPAAFTWILPKCARLWSSRALLTSLAPAALAASSALVNKTPGPGLQVAPNFSAGSFGFVNPSVTASLGKHPVQALVAEDAARQLGMRFF